jgi:cytochrome c biogenesis protein CcdA
MRYIRKLKQFIRYGHPYKKTTYVAMFGIALILVFALIFLLPNADANSVQAGLTIIAEILGVLLGVVLVVVGLLVEQRFQAEEHLRGILQKYRSLIQSQLGAVNSGRQQFITQAREGKIQLSEPIFVGPSGTPSSTTFRDIIGALSTLSSIYSAMLAKHEFERVEEDLKDLGYSEDEAIHILYVRASTADTDAEEFLRLVDEALDFTCIPAYCDNQVSDLALQIYQQYERDGVSTALRRLDRTRRFLKSRVFVAGLIVPTLTTVLAVLTIFGITDTTVYLSAYGSIVVAIMIGFVLSVVLTLLLVEKMFA